MLVEQVFSKDLSPWVRFFIVLLNFLLLHTCRLARPERTSHENVASKGYRIIKKIVEEYQDPEEAKGRVQDALDPVKPLALELDKQVAAEDSKAMYNCCVEIIGPMETLLDVYEKSCGGVDVDTATSTLKNFVKNGKAAVQDVLQVQESGVTTYVSAKLHSEAAAGAEKGRDGGDSDGEEDDEDGGSDFEWLVAVIGVLVRCQRLLNEEDDSNYLWAEVHKRLEVISRAFELAGSPSSEASLDKPVERLHQWSSLYNREVEIVATFEKDSFPKCIMDLCKSMRASSVGFLIYRFISSVLIANPEKHQEMVNAAATLQGSLPANCVSLVDKHREYMKLTAMKNKIVQKKNPGIIEMATLLQSSKILDGIGDNEVGVPAATVASTLSAVAKSFRESWEQWKGKSDIGDLQRCHQRYNCVRAAAESWDFSLPEVSFLKLEEQPAEIEKDMVLMTRMVKTFVTQLRTLESLAPVSTLPDVNAEISTYFKEYREEKSKHDDILIIVQCMMLCNAILVDRPNKDTQLDYTYKYLCNDLGLKHADVPNALKLKVCELRAEKKRAAGEDPDGKSIATSSAAAPAHGDDNPTPTKKLKLKKK